MVIRKVLLACAFVFLASWAQNGFIAVDQFGYRPEAQKTAVISYEPGAALQVINQATGESVFSGAPTSFQGGAVDAASGDKIWWFDFSSVEEPGTYYIKDASNSKESYSFRIASDIYNNVLQAAIKVFYYQRSAFEKKAEFAGTQWADGASHLQDSDSRLYSEPDNAAKSRDLRGGWYDAGDYNKYTAWTANYVESMLAGYLENPEAFTDDYNIPESGNGIPDIIDEAKYGMDWLLKMQNSDGSMLSVVGMEKAKSSDNPDASPPSAVTGRSIYGPPNTIATITSAKAFALGAIVFGELGQSSYAASLKTAALNAYNWAVNNPEVLFHNNCGDSWNKDNCPNYDSRGLGAGDQEPTELENGTQRPRLSARLQAALYLYELTKESSYLNTVESNYKKFPLYEWSGFMDQYRFSDHLMYLHYLRLPAGSESVKTDLKSTLIGAFNKTESQGGRLAGLIGKDGYRSWLEIYDWGSNQHKSNNGNLFYIWAKQGMESEKSELYIKTAEDYLHYIHGVNPMNLVYLSNMKNYGASNSLNEIYHTWFSHESNKWNSVLTSAYGPAPCYLAGGANERFKWDGCCSNNTCGSGDGWSNNDKCTAEPIPVDQPPAKMYKDFNTSWPLNSWEVSEPSGGYQMAYIRLLSKFVEPKGQPIMPIKKNIKPANPAIATAHWSGNSLVIQSARAIDYVALFDLKNRIVAAHSGGSSEIRLNADIPAGVYYLKVKSGSAVMVRAMIRK